MTRFVIKRIGYPWFYQGPGRWGSDVEAAEAFEFKMTAALTAAQTGEPSLVVVAVSRKDPPKTEPRYVVQRRDGWLWLGDDQWIEKLIPSRPPRFFEYANDAEKAALVECLEPSEAWTVIPMDEPVRT
jgi:hypothetical protein